MARTNRIKSERDAHYHVMSRTNGKRFLFDKSDIKTMLVDILRRTAEFSGVRLEAYVAMGNHFHAIVKVEKPELPVTEEELLRRIGILKGEKGRDAIARRWRRLADAGNKAALDVEHERFRARMHDISQFVKTFKEEFDRAFKHEHTYCGSIWSGRFTSTIIENGEYLARCKKYVVYNPVRAGIVSRAEDYQWSWCEDDTPFPTGTAPVEMTNEDHDEQPSMNGYDMNVRVIKREVYVERQDEWWMRRMTQLVGGKIFGSASFVIRTATALRDRFTAKGITVRPVGNIGFATHGYRLAKAA